MRHTNAEPIVSMWLLLCRMNSLLLIVAFVWTCDVGKDVPHEVLVTSVGLPHSTMADFRNFVWH